MDNLFGISKSLDGRAIIKKLSSKKALDVYCLLSVILISGIWALLSFDKCAVISEGWYVTYSEMILAGKVPYRDFELLFPPLYTYLTTAFILAFGKSLLAFRILGVLIYVSLTILAYNIFKLISPSWIAAIATIVTVFTIQSEVVYISYDYIRVYDLFNNLAFFLFLRLIIRSYKDEYINVNLNMFSIGIFCALAILIRQTTGSMVFVYFFLFIISIIILSRDIKIKRNNFYCFLIGFLLPLLITFAVIFSVGAFTSFIDMTLLSGSKGSLFSMLFGWIPRLFIDSTHNLTLAIGMAVCLALIVGLKTTDITPKENKSNYLLYYITAIIIAIVAIILFFSYEYSLKVLQYRESLLLSVFIFNAVLGLAVLYRILVKYKNKESPSISETVCIFFCGFIFVLGYGAGTSGGLCEGQAALSFGFFVSLFLTQINKIPKRKLRQGLKITVMALTIVLVATAASTKVVTPYNWWGLVVEPYDNAQYYTEISYFDGIKLTADEKYLYEDFVEVANTYLGENDELYCYSQIPIFYTLADIIPTVKAPVCWFDVSRDITLLDDLEYLKQDNPKMIVFADHGNYALDIHEQWFREDNISGHRVMYEWLLDCRDNPKSDYKIFSAHHVQNYDVYFMLLE